jgi:uncharacterized protein YdgA (DUF945 family)
MSKRLTVALLAIVIAVAAAAAAFAAISWRAGGDIEQAIAAQQAVVARQPWLKVVSQSYARGVFSSHAETTVELQGQTGRIYGELFAKLAGTAAPLRITYLHDISHGPLPGWSSGDLGRARARVATRLRLNDAYAQKLPELFGPAAAPLFVTDFFAEGGGVTHVALPAIVRALDQGGKLAWQGLAGDVRFDAAYDAFVADLHMAGLELATPQGRLSISGIALNSDLKRGAQRLMLGKTMLRVARAEIAGAQSGLVEGLEYGAGAVESGDFIDVSGAFAVARANVAGSAYGPARLAIAMDHLHGPTLAMMQAEFEALERSQLAPEQQRQAMTELVGRFFAELLQHQPTLRLTELSLQTPDGDLRLNADLGWPGYTGAEPVTPAALGNATEASAELSISEALARKLGEAGARQNLRVSANPPLPPGPEGEAELQTRAQVAVVQQLGALVEQGLVSREEGRLKVRARFHGGQLELNGRPVPLPGAAPVPAPVQPAAPLRRY